MEGEGGSGGGRNQEPREKLKDETKTNITQSPRGGGGRWGGRSGEGHLLAPWAASRGLRVISAQRSEGRRDSRG